jgi:hypothetical protein
LQLGRLFQEEDCTWLSRWEWESALFNMSGGLDGLEFMNEELRCNLIGSTESLKAFDES